MWLNVFDGCKSSMFGLVFGDMFGGKGLCMCKEEERDNDFDSADVFIVVNLSTIEFESLEKFVDEMVNGRLFIGLNL